MNRNKLIFFITIVLGLVSCRQWFHDVMAVSLDEKTFLEQVGGENHLVIEFFTPWCGYCQQMSGEYNKLFSHYHHDQGTRKDVQISKVNCQQHQDLCEELGVDSYPTIVIYASGNRKVRQQIFSGGRSFQNMKAWIDNNLPPYVPPNANNNEKHEQQKRDKDQPMNSNDQINEEQERVREEELMRVNEKEHESEHRESMLQFEKEEEEKQIREQQERLNKQNEERLQKQEEERKKKEEEERKKREEDEQLKKRKEEEKQKKQQQDDIKVTILNNNNDGKNNLSNDLTTAFNNLSQTSLNIQHNTEVVPTVQSIVQGLKVNLEYTIKKISLLEDHQSHQKQQMQTILSEIQNLQQEVNTFLQKQKEAKDSKPQQNLHIVNPGNAHIVHNQGFNLVHSLIFFAFGLCVGYMFSRFFGKV